MRWFSRLRIRNKFFLIGLLNIPFAFLIAGAGVWGISQMDYLLKSIENKDLMAIYSLSQTKTLILEARIAGRQALLETDPIPIQTNSDTSRNKRDQALAQWQIYLALPLTEAAKTASKSFDQNFSNFVNEYEQILALARNHTAQNQAEGVALLNQNNGRNLIANLDNLIALQKNEALATEKEARITREDLNILIPGFTGVMLILFFAAIAWLARIVSKPIIETKRIAVSIANGNLAERIKVNSKDEIGELGQAFNQMAANLAFAQKTRQEISEVVKNNVMQMTTQLRNTAYQQSSGSEEQATSILQVNLSVKELNAAATNIAILAEQVSQAARIAALDSHQIEQTTHLAVLQSNRGVEAVASTSQISQQVANLYEQLVENMHALSAKTASMQLILDLLNSISQQTHILSLNAAIEAAGIGVGAERFAVIAQEVRNLALNASTASKEVVIMVQEITQTAQTALANAQNGSLKAIELAQTALEAGQVIEMLQEVTRQSEQQANSFTTTAQKTHELTTVIKISANQQRTSNQQVLEALNGLSAIAQQIAEGSHFVSDTAQNLEDVTRSIEMVLN